MGEVVELGVTTTLDIAPDKVLEGAKGKLDRVLVIGTDKDGNEYLASSTGDRESLVWLLERTKHALINAADLC